MNRFDNAIAATIRSFHPSVSFGKIDGIYSCELGGLLPCRVVTYLKHLGCEVLEYVHHGVTATVIRF
jgi:hypothetical protein